MDIQTITMWPDGPAYTEILQTLCESTNFDDFMKQRLTTFLKSLVEELSKKKKIEKSDNDEKNEKNDIDKKKRKVTFVLPEAKKLRRANPALRDLDGEKSSDSGSNSMPDDPTGGVSSNSVLPDTGSVGSVGSVSSVSSDSVLPDNDPTDSDSEISSGNEEIKFRSTNKSGYFGVTKSGKTKWEAQFFHKGIRTYLGCKFATKEDAALAYDVAAIKAGRPLSRLNFPEQVPEEYRLEKEKEARKKKTSEKEYQKIYRQLKSEKGEIVREKQLCQLKSKKGKIAKKKSYYKPTGKPRGRPKKTKNGFLLNLLAATKINTDNKSVMANVGDEVEILWPYVSQDDNGHEQKDLRPLTGTVTKKIKNGYKIKYHETNTSHFTPFASKSDTLPVFLESREKPLYSLRILQKKREQ